MIPGITADFPISGAAPFSPFAVRIDDSAGANYLTIASQTVADANSFTASLWMKIAPPFAGVIPGIFQLSTGGSASFANILGNGTIQAVLNDSGGSNSLTISSNSSAMPTDDAWHHLYVRADLNHAAGAKIYELLLDGVSILYAPNCIDTSPSFSVGVHGKSFFIPGDPAFDDTIIQLAEAWLAVGQNLDSATHLSKFRSSGAPVFLGAHGQLPSGIEPTYYFSGNASSFPVNNGSGDAVTLHGSITTVTGPP